MNIRNLLVLFAGLASIGSAANLALSTYLKDGFVPAAIGSDQKGNIYVAGTAVIDPAAQATSVAVAKINPALTQYLYLSYFDSASSDQVSAITVDAAGNAYIAGSTLNPNFPVVGAAALGTAPTSASDPRSYVVKLNPQGVVVFSTLIGGSAASHALGLALMTQGQILISGIAGSKGFPATPGALSIADSTNQWYLMELDSSASKVIFSATGIGGSSIVPDAAGNIYMSGSSVGTTYPTTPGAYQTTFVQGQYCFGFCRFGFLGGLQHVTKTDAAASKLIYSTGLNHMGRAGSTVNTGLAVDAAGNAYVTGTLFEASYPFTVDASPDATSFLSKLDPSGANALFSIPVGGGGVQLDSSGNLYVGGTVASLAPVGFPNLPGPHPGVAIPSAFASINPLCVPNFLTAISEAYVMKVNAATGDVVDAQWIDGSGSGATGITLAAGKVWITGPTPGPQAPTSPGALTPQNLGPGFLAGSYLSAVDFTSAASGPAISCVLDSGNLSHVGAVASFQLLSIFGSNLGPATPVSSPDGDASLGGVSVTFDGRPAQLLYVSDGQVNVAVPPPVPSGPALPTATVMRLTYAGGVVERQFPFTLSNLNLFADLSSNLSPCPNVSSDIGFQPLALNADGSRNSCTNPAKVGTMISLFAHGAGGFGSPPSPLSNLHASVGFGCTSLVTSAALISSFVYKVDISLPPSLTPCEETLNSVLGVPLTLHYNEAPVGPLNVPADLSGPLTNFSPPGTPMTMIIWMKP